MSFLTYRLVKKNIAALASKMHFTYKKALDCMIIYFKTLPVMTVYSYKTKIYMILIAPLIALLIIAVGPWCANIHWWWGNRTV